jgi:hypothetical protein
MTKRKVNAKALARDVSRGLPEESLMERHGLTAVQLHAAVGKLVEAGMVDQAHVARDTAGSPGDPMRPGSSTFSIMANEAGYAGARTADPGVCPQCGFSRSHAAGECPRCGVVFAKVDSRATADQPVSQTSGSPYHNPEPTRSQERMAEFFRQEAEEVVEARQRKRRFAVFTAIGVAVLSLVMVLLGFGKAVAIAYSLAFALFLFIYYFVVLYHAFQESTVWGLLCFFIAPAALVFVILNLHNQFEGRLLPRIWLAGFGVMVAAQFYHLF